MNSEKMLIGQIITDNSIFHSLDIDESDFNDVELRRVYRAIDSCITDGLEADLITICNRDTNISPSTLSNVTSHIVSTANWKYYHDKIASESYKRKVKRLASQFTDWTKTMSPDEAIQELEKSLMDIVRGKKSNQVQKIKEVVPEFVDLIEERYKTRGTMPGIASGISELDTMTLGFRDRMFYLIGGRPSQGKSALLLNMACHAGIDLNKRVGYISTESSVMEIVTRLFASRGKIDSMKLITGILPGNSFASITNISDKVYEKEMYFYYTPGMTLDNLIQIARLMVRYYKVDIIYVDYLQDITIHGNDTTLDKTKAKSKTMKYLAEELDIPFVVGAQLRRDAEERRPRLSDFSDSSQLEKDADGAILIYHHHVNKSEPRETPEYESYLLAEKVRDGRVGQIPVYFKKEYVTFTERQVHD